MRNFLCAILLLFSFYGSTGVVSAQESKTFADNTSQQAVVVATVNLKNASILTQEGNKIHFAFDINNRVGAQGQIRYGAYLREANKTQKIAPFVYDEIVSVPAGQNLHKELVYEAPSYLTGEYQLYVEAMTTEGLPLGFIMVGPLALTAFENTAPLSVECKRTYRDVVPKNNPLELQCSFVSGEEKTLLPTVTTYRTTEYGQEVKQEHETPLALNKGQTSHTFSVTAASESGSYVLKVGFVDEKQNNYSAPVIYYSVAGASASVTNAVFDKDKYVEGDVANLSIVWMASSTEANAALLEARILSDGGVCSDIKQVALDKQSSSLSFSLPITKSCNNPKASLVIKDSNGNVIGKAEYAVSSIQDAPVMSRVAGYIPTWIKASYLYILALIVAVGLFFLLKKWRQSKRLHTFLFLSFSLSLSFLGANEAKADTIMVNGWPIAVSDLTEVHTIRYEPGNPNTDVYPGSWASISNYYNGQCYGQVRGLAQDFSAGYFNVTTNAGGFEDIPDSQGLTPNGTDGCGNFITIDMLIDARVSLGGSMYTGPGPYEARWNFRIGNAIVQYRDFFDVVMDATCAILPPPPASGSCNNGTKTNANETATEYTWDCVPVDPRGNRASCSVAKQDAECGAAYFTPSATAPTDNLCAQGTPTGVTDGGSRWEWFCNGALTQNHYCFTWKSGGGIAEDGQCGTRNTTYPAGTPTWPGGSTYCAVGTPSVSPDFPASGSTAYWACSGVSGGASASCAATHDAGMAASPSLKICESSCASSIEPPASFSMARGTTKNLVACYNNAVGCTDASGDVTASTVWTDTASNVVSLSGSHPKVVTANQVGVEAIRARYGATTLTRNISVVCSDAGACGRDPRYSSLCTNQSFSVTDSCGQNQLCHGTKSCDYNWREVAPE